MTIKGQNIRCCVCFVFVGIAALMPVGCNHIEKKTISDSREAKLFGTGNGKTERSDTNKTQQHVTAPVAKLVSPSPSDKKNNANLVTNKEAQRGNTCNPKVEPDFYWMKSECLENEQEKIEKKMDRIMGAYREKVTVNYLNSDDKPTKKSDCLSFKRMQKESDKEMVKASYVYEIETNGANDHTCNSTGDVYPLVDDSYLLITDSDKKCNLHATIIEQKILIEKDYPNGCSNDDACGPLANIVGTSFRLKLKTKGPNCYE